MSTQTARRSSGLLVALAACMALQIGSLAMVLPLFARRFEGFGAGVQALAVSDMAYALTAILAAPVVGMLADRLGRRPIVLVSLAGLVLVYVGYLFAASAWLLILLRGLAGVFTGGLLPAVMSIVGDLAPENRRAQWIGIVNGGGAAGYTVGPFLGGLLYDGFGYIVPFAASSVMAAGALVLALARVPETYAPGAHPGRRPSACMFGWQSLPARSTFLLLMLITFGVMFAWAFVGPQFMFYAYDDLRWTALQLGLVMSIFSVAFMAGAFALGQVSDRLGRKPVLVLGLALFSAQFVGLVIFRDMAGIALSFVLAGLGNALYDPALGAMILDITPAEHTASMMGLKSTAGSLGSLLGPASVALFTSFLGPRDFFLIATALVAVLGLVSGLALRFPGGVQLTHLRAATRP